LDDVIRTKYPEVTICYDGKRTIEGPDSRWFEFTGKAAPKNRRSDCRTE
jgi:hypothetical protein